MVAQIDAKYCRTRPWKAVTRLISYVLFEGRPLTTKGQWINPLLFQLFAVAKKIPALKQVKQPVFILGTGRSGTTVLGVVLSMHREVGFLNEPKALWHSIHDNEDLIGSYSRGKAYYRLNADVASEKRCQWIHKLYGAYLTSTLSKRIVDKYPELIFRVPFVKALFPDAKFIFLMRNGWDTCRSIDNWSDRLGESVNGETHDWWGVNKRKWKLLVDQIIPDHSDLAIHKSEIANFTNQTDMAAVEWIVTMREGLSLLKSHPDDMICIRFEDLSKYPDAMLRKLASDLDLGHDPAFINYGIHTLHPVPASGEFQLNPILIDPFNDTMKRLGYA